MCLLHELGQCCQEHMSVISNFLEPKEEYAWILFVLFLAISQPACWLVLGVQVPLKQESEREWNCFFLAVPCI